MDVFLGFIAAFGFNFPPRGWALCQGQVLSIQQNTALFSLLGTTYGGNGQTTFGLPDLRGRTLIGMGQGGGLQNYVQGQMAGTESVTLTSQQLASHQHVMMGSGDAQAVGSVAGSSLGSVARGSSTGNIYVSGATNQVAMGSSTAAAGGNQAHPNMQPYLAINYSIALQGIFPSRN